MASQRIPLYCVSDSCKDLGIRRDSGATYPPLALGMMLAYARTFGEVWERYELVRTLISTESEIQDSYREHGPGVYLFSDYIWTLKNNLRLSELAKRLDRRSVAIHGGPSMPKYADACDSFFSANPHVDIGVRGEGENTMVELLRTLSLHAEELDPEALSQVAGITFRSHVGRPAAVRTAEREREKDLDRFPSPYLTGVFDAFQDIPETWTAAIIETNRGCPYGCTFCDWGSATLQKIHRFSIERIAQEIQWAAEHKVARLWIADANFGILERDVAIADLICEARARFGYPRDVIVNYAKNATARLAEIIRRFRKASLSAAGIISIQTHDPETLANVNRSNIKTERYEDLIEIFRNEGLPVSSDLLIGLPGATPETFKNDLQFFIDRQVHTVAYPVMVLANSPMGERSYLERFGISLDQNGYIISTNSFSRMDLWKMKMTFCLYRGAIGYSILKYFLYYVQVDAGIRAADFISALAQHLLHPDCELTRCSTVFMRHCLADDRAALLAMSELDWEELYREVLDFAAEHFDLREESAADAIVTAQIALMPRLGRELPDRVLLPHDVAAYFEQFRWTKDLSSLAAGTVRPLSHFGPAELSIMDPEGFCGSGYIQPVDLHQPPRWELSSQLSLPRETRGAAQPQNKPHKLVVL